MTEAETRPRRRSNSISEYSQIFSQAGPKPSTFIGQKRHPSLSMRHDRSTSIGKLGLNVPMLSAVSNESAIDDTDTPLVSNREAPAKSEDAVGLGRRLSQGARAIMFNGNRLRGESIAASERPRQTRTCSMDSVGSATSSVAKSPVLSSEARAADDLVSQNAVEAAKQIRRRLSPTGERMLRGELAFH